jgi:DNA-3-methyladenine glycosylase
VKELDKAKRLALKPLSQEFYLRETVQVAQDLLGKVLTVKLRPHLPWEDPKSEVVSGRIVETEAYSGNDPASHSCRGETPRCQVMFGEPGVAYVYFIYGMYEMLNFVTEPPGQAGAVLIRAVEPLFGLEIMSRRRKIQKTLGKNVIQLTSGPGKLCRAFGIQMNHNGQSLMGPELYVSDDGFQPRSISQSGRVGIRLATEKPWRFFETGNPFVSRVPQNLESQVVHV